MLDIGEWVFDNVQAAILSHISLNEDNQVQIFAISTTFYVIHALL